MKKQILASLLIMLYTLSSASINAESTHFNSITADSTGVKSEAFVNINSFSKYSIAPQARYWESTPVVKYVNRRQLQIQNQLNKTVSQSKANRYALSVNWPESYQTMVFSFSLKSKIPDYKSIHYKPSYLNKLYSANNSALLLNEQTTITNSLSTINSSSIIYNLMDSMIIYQPKFVKYQWKEIPSPHKFVLEGILLDRKAAHDAFMLQNVEIKKLEKPKQAVKDWTYSGVEAMQVSQSYFSNWVKGGQNAISLLSDLRASANYKKDWFAWDNKGIHKLGIISTEGERSRINDDLIQLTSKAGINASERWYYSTLFDFKSQFFYGRDKNDPSQILSGFMAPAYLTFAVGMDYKRPDFTFLLSPLTSKVTLVLDTANVDQTRYNVPEGHKSTSQTGASVISSYKWRINTEFTLLSNFDLFYGYMNKNPDTQMDWELIFDMRINKFLSSRINTTFRYFESESNKLQVSENFSVAFNYKF
jgi:hypothetical protein